jgi:hypothetical protein
VPLFFLNGVAVDSHFFKNQMVLPPVAKEQNDKTSQTEGRCLKVGQFVLLHE